VNLSHFSNFKANLTNNFSSFEENLIPLISAISFINSSINDPVLSVVKLRFLININIYTLLFDPE
jgi:hypothetical protein